MFKPISDLIKSIANDSNSLLNNRYKLENLLGKGAMGEVYCASDQNLGDVQVAIKFLSQTLLQEKMRIRFQNEAKISALLGEKSMHIVKVKDYGLKDNKIPFYVMELLQGNSLDKIIKMKTLSINNFLLLTRQICLGLECAHNGIFVDNEICPIIHRDIKPSNIFVIPEPNLGELVKILDFGIAQVIDSEHSETQTFMGTYQYCSPEQMAEKELDPRSDIYSLGILMYEMLTQKAPIKTKHHGFKGWYEAHHNVSPPPFPRYLKLPDDLEKIIMSCLAKSPDDRPRNVGEILKIINSLIRDYKPKKNPVNLKQSDTPSAPPKSNNIVTIKEIYLQSSWPENKPQLKIVFPMITDSKEGTFASLWTMLESKDINKFAGNSTFSYHHFIFQESPHPMLLWANLFYVHDYEPKWLPCYLDLKTKLGNQIVTNLIKHKVYYILLFDLNNSQQYQEILTVNIGDDKVKQLENYLQKSNSWKGDKQPEVTKRILKQHFEKVKVTILQAIKKVKSH